MATRRKAGTRPPVDTAESTQAASPVAAAENARPTVEPEQAEAEVTSPVVEPEQTAAAAERALPAEPQPPRTPVHTIRLVRGPDEPVRAGGHVLTAQGWKLEGSEQT